MTQLTTKQLQAAREWLCDCTFADTEPEEFEVMSATDIERGIARLFHGGIPAFIESFSPAEPPSPHQTNEAPTGTETHKASRAEAAPAKRKRPAGARSVSADLQGSTMEPTPQTNLWGQYQPTPLKGRQIPLFHEPVEVPTPDTRPAVDRRIARKFDEAATPLLFTEPPTKPGQR